MNKAVFWYKDVKGKGQLSGRRHQACKTHALKCAYLAPDPIQTPTRPQLGPNQKDGRIDRERHRQKFYIHASHLSLNGAELAYAKQLGSARGDY